MPHAGLALGSGACAIFLGVFVLAYMLRLMIVQFEEFVQIAPQYNLNLPGSVGATLALIVGAALAVLVLNPLTTLVLLA